MNAQRIITLNLGHTNTFSLSQQSFVSEEIFNTFTPNKMHILLVHTLNTIYRNELEAQFPSSKFPLLANYLPVNKALK